jgi:O-antigen ligase
VPTWLGRAIFGVSYELYSELADVSASGALYLSLDRSATLSGFVLQCALVAVFFGIVSMADSRKRLRALLVLFFAVGFAEALYGLIVYLGGGQLGLWDPGHDAGTVSGTYVNQNHFAGLMEITIPAGMGLLLMGRASRETGSGLRAALRSMASTLMGQQGMVLFGLLVMFAALILSTSRGAVGSLAVGVIVAVSVAMMRNGARARELRVGLIAAVLMVFAILWLGTGQLSSKLESSGLASNRGDLRELSYRMIADSPVVGTGVGTYRWIFPRYKDQRFGSGFYEHAHNDYLEILGEQGIVGFSLLAVALGLIAAKIVKAYRQHHEPLVRGALFAAVAGCTALLVHGFVDFNFQIPANAAYFSALLGIGVVAAGIGRASTP